MNLIEHGASILRRVIPRQFLQRSGVAATFTKTTPKSVGGVEIYSGIEGIPDGHYRMDENFVLQKMSDQDVEEWRRSGAGASTVWGSIKTERKLL